MELSYSVPAHTFILPADGQQHVALGGAGGVVMVVGILVGVVDAI